MALARVKNWIAEVLRFDDLNAEFNNILNNPMSLISPLTGDLDIDGKTLTLDAAAVTQLVSSSAVSFSLTSGAKTGTPATTGSVANWSAQTFTDSATAGSGTATAFVAHGIQRPTLAATNASVVTTDAATFYIANSPAAGTNETITSAWALWTDDGGVRHDLTKTVVSAAGAVLRGLYLPAVTETVTGSTNITTATGFNLVEIGIPTLSAASALTVTNAATLYISGAPAGAGAGPATITNAYALWVDGGVARFDDDIHWLSGTAFSGILAHNNTASRTYTFPDADIALANWSTGDVKLTFKIVADSGWVMADDGTIGNGSSGGTTRANADTEALFTLLWNNVADAQAPVSTGRGANAAADFAANKTIALTKVLGRALGIAGAGSGLTSRVLGLTTGVETHALSIAENALHGHTFRTDPTVGAGSDATGGFMMNNAAPQNNVAFTGTPTDTQGQQIGGSGSGTAHQNMQPTSFLNVMIKL